MTITEIHGSRNSSHLSCSAVINGTSATANNGMVKATFTNKTSTLKVLSTGGNLHLYNVTCPVTATGDSVNFTGSYKFIPETRSPAPELGHNRRSQGHLTAGRLRAVPARLVALLPVALPFAALPS